MRQLIYTIFVTNNPTPFQNIMTLIIGVIKKLLQKLIKLMSKITIKNLLSYRKWRNKRPLPDKRPRVGIIFIK